MCKCVLYLGDNDEFDLGDDDADVGFAAILRSSGKKIRILYH